MAVKIRLKRLGKIRAPYYRIVVADSRTKRDGRVIEEIGKYHPTESPSLIEVNSERAQYWLGVGAQPTEQVTALLKLTGDWGTFKGEKGAKNTVQTAEPKPEFKADAKKKPVLRPKAAKPVVEESPVAEAPAEAEAPAAEEAPSVTNEASEEAPAAEVASEEAAVEEVATEETGASEASPEEPAAETPASEEPAEEPAVDEAADETKPAE